MGAIGGLLGVNGGAGGSGFGGPSAGVADPTGNNNLQATYTQLGNIANGQGPNPAMAQYNQNIQNVAKQQAGAISSVQGISPALAARLASQQGSAAMQNAAGQGATMQAQQQLGALGQQGAIAGNQANIAAGLQQNVNNANSGLAQTTMGGQQALIGGLMNSAGAAAGGMANGGMVPKMADGGSVPMSQFAQFLSGQSSQPAPMAVQATPMVNTSAGQQALKSGASGGMQKAFTGAPGGAENAGQGPTMAAASAPVGGIPYTAAMPTYGMAGGGNVPAMVSPGEAYLSPQKVQQFANGGQTPQQMLKSAEKIPGKAAVKGNSYANDTVKKNLQPGGIVIPREQMNSKDQAAAAARFVAAVIAKKGKK